MAFKRSAVRLRLAPPSLKARLLQPGLLLFALSWPGLAAAAEWQAPAFGQTLAQLDAAFSGRLTVIPPRIYGPFMAERMLRRVEVAGMPFDVLFQHDPATGRLAQVLAQSRLRAPTGANYRSIASVLSRGAPAASCAREASGGLPARAETVWTAGGRTTRVSWFDFNSGAMAAEDPNTAADPLQSRAARSRNNPQALPRRIVVRIAPAAAGDGPDCGPAPDAL